MTREGRRGRAKKGGNRTCEGKKKGQVSVAEKILVDFKTCLCTEVSVCYCSLLTHHAILLQVALALLQGDKVATLCPVQRQATLLGPLVGVCHWVLEHIHLFPTHRKEILHFKT